MMTSVHCPRPASAADPSPEEVRSGVNLADVAKCSCASRFCTAAAHGSVPFSSGNSSALVTLRADLPPFPFDNVGADASCSNCEWWPGLTHL